MSITNRPLALTMIRLALFFACVLAGLGQVQASCRSTHCGDEVTPPASCGATAQIRIPVVVVTGSFGSFRFEPDQPRIEPGSCVEWDALTVTHSSTADGCSDLSTTQCDAASPDPACLWETGNLASAGLTVLCHYTPALLPSSSAEGFYCRPHSSPSHSGTMFGTLRVTEAIQLTVGLSPGGEDVELSWTGGDGGGITPAARRFKISRSTGDPAFAGALDTFAPTGGVSGTSFSDTGEGRNTSMNRFYLVLHRQTNE